MQGKRTSCLNIYSRFPESSPSPSILAPELLSCLSCFSWSASSVRYRSSSFSSRVTDDVAVERGEGGGILFDSEFVEITSVLERLSVFDLLVVVGLTVYMFLL